MTRSDFDFAVLFILIILIWSEVVSGVYAAIVVTAVICYTFFKFLDIFLDQK